MTNVLKSIRGSIMHWYLLTIAGILFIGAGLFAISNMNETYVVLVFIFSVTFLLIGISEIIYAISNTKTVANWGWILAIGIISGTVGGIMLNNPEIPATVLPFFVSILLLVSSISLLSFAYDLKSYGILDWGNVQLIGALGIILSLVLLFNPLTTAYSTVLLTGINLMIVGVGLIYVSLRLKKIKNFPKNLEQSLRHRLKDLEEEVQNSIQQVKKNIEEVGDNLKSKVSGN